MKPSQNGKLIVTFCARENTKRYTLNLRGIILKSLMFGRAHDLAFIVTVRIQADIGAEKHT